VTYKIKIKTTSHVHSEPEGAHHKATTLSSNATPHQKYRGEPDIRFGGAKLEINKNLELKFTNYSR
jgi:hypothetical protein